MYEAETGFYYVSSRYYDPETGRWLNADSYASTGTGILGHNMFAYCGNNPIVNVDIGGTFYERTAGGGFGGVPYSGGGGGGGGRSIPIDLNSSARGVAAVSVTILYGLSTEAMREESINFNSRGEFCVYTLSDPVTKNIEYVGRTKNPSARKTAHGVSETKGHLKFTIIASILTLGGWNKY